MPLMITIWRRHVPACQHSSKGRAYLKCSCPLWADGYVDGRRTLRKSLGTRDLARARKKAMLLESPETRTLRTIDDAVTAFLDHCSSEGIRLSTMRKYRNTLALLKAFCCDNAVDYTWELGIDQLDRFRSSRKLAPITSLKELQLLRQFCSFCRDRRWMEDNPAKRIKSARNLRKNDIEPFTPAEIVQIIRACDEYGRNSYERLRARAMVLTLRYTALRIGDVAMLARDRISCENDRWRIFLRTEKNGKPVFLPIPNELKVALDCVPVPRGTLKESKYYFWNGISTEVTIKSVVDRSLHAVFRKSLVPCAHAHRFRHTLATELLGRGASFEDIADILGNSPRVVREHYAKWSSARQSRIDSLMESVHAVSYQNPASIQ